MEYAVEFYYVILILALGIIMAFFPLDLQIFDIRKRDYDMKCLTLRADNKMDYTTVSNIFIDNFMPQASGEFVKIYLYLLRCMSDPNMDISISSIADRFDHTEKDVLRALRYFASKGLISIEYNKDDELSAITFLPFNSEFTVIKKNEDKEKCKEKDSEQVNEQAKDSNDEIPVISKDEAVSGIKPKPAFSVSRLKSLCANEELSQLLYITEKYLGKTLTSSETNTILYMYDTLDFSCELIEYLIEYCVSNNHKSMRYIEKVAISWAEENIDSVEKAKEMSNTYSTKVYSVLKAFGISGRNPGKKEMDLINKWYADYNFSNDIVLEACNRTISTIHSPSFEYADSILRKWRDNNVSSLSDISALDASVPKPVKIFNARNQHTASEKPAAKFTDFPQRTYDFDKLEKKIMED